MRHPSLRSPSAPRSSSAASPPPRPPLPDRARGWTVGAALGALGAALFAVLPSHAFAAEPPVATLEEDLVVTATVQEEERADVPATVRVITGEEARQRQAESVAELLATTAGAHVVVSGAAGQQTSLFVRGSESDQVLVLWNGVPLNTPYDGAFNAAFLPTEGISRIEVVPGPFSALYGGSALGGVVQVLTARESRSELAVEAGEGDHRRVALASSRAAGPLQATLTGHLREAEGALVGERYDGREGALHLDWSARENLQVGLLGRLQRADTSHPVDGAGGLSPDRRNDVDERQWAVPVQWTLPRWELAGSLSQVRFDATFRDPRDPFGFIASDTESHAERARAAGTRHLARGWWAAGVEGERLEADNRSVFGVNLDAARQENRAAFAQLHLEAARWAADLGVRHDDNDVYGSATSPRLGVVWAALPALRLRASYGEGFRAPNFVDLFFPFTGNPDLAPERGRSAELGVEVERGAWRVDLALFENRQRDLIGSDPLSFRSINIARSRARGIEGELGFHRGALTLRLGGAWVDAEDLRTGLSLVRRPRESAFLVASGQPGRATLSLVAAWVGESRDVVPNPPYGVADNPGHFTVDLAAGWQALPWLAPLLRLENALDEEYEPALGYPAPGRRLIAGARLTR
jgi:vitamin B12 transporter